MSRADLDIGDSLDVYLVTEGPRRADERLVTVRKLRGTVHERYVRLNVVDSVTGRAHLFHTDDDWGTSEAEALKLFRLSLIGIRDTHYQRIADYDERISLIEDMLHEVDDD